MRYECLAQSVYGERKSVYLTQKDIYDLFSRVICEAGQKIPAGTVLLEYTDIVYKKDDGPWVRAKGFLFKILDQNNRLHIWSFSRAEALPIIRQYMLEKNYALGEEPFNPIVALPAAGIIMYL